MDDSKNLERFLAAYGMYHREILQPTRRELKEVLRKWKDPIRPDYWAHYAAKTRLPAPSPIQRVLTRIKRPENVVDKIYRKPTSFPHQLSPESFRQMSDTVGGRAIVYFLSQLPLVDREIRAMTDVFEISEQDPPKVYMQGEVARVLGLDRLDASEKDSGYASVHYILRFRESSVPEADRPWFELQVRTLTEDVWAEIEHLLGYKPGKRTMLAVRKEFSLLSSHLRVIDDHFNFIFEELSRHQDEVQFNDNDPLNAENFPAVLAESSLGCAQREVDSLLKILASRGFKSIADFRQTATARRMERIRNIYRNEKGRAPRNFEMIATLASLRGLKNDEDETSLIRAQILYLEAWDGLKANEREGQQ